MTRKPVLSDGRNGKNLETVIFCLNAPAGPTCHTAQDGHHADGWAQVREGEGVR